MLQKKPNIHICLNYTFALGPSCVKRKHPFTVTPWVLCFPSSWSGTSKYISSELQHNKLSAAEDGKCFLRLHPSSNPCFDCNPKDTASIPMISLVLDPYFVAARKSRLPSGAGLVYEIPLFAIKGSRREIERDDKDKIKLHFVLIVWLLVGERPLQSTGRPAGEEWMSMPSRWTGSGRSSDTWCRRRREQQLQESHANGKEHQSAGRGWKRAMVCNISWSQHSSARPHCVKLVIQSVYIVSPRLPDFFCWATIMPSVPEQRKTVRHLKL